MRNAMSNPTDNEGTHTPGVRKGEEMVKEEGKEPGRTDTGTTGAGRPAGTATGRDSSTVAPTDPIDPASPDLPPA
jgi:hypothetical protein